VAEIRNNYLPNASPELQSHINLLRGS